MSDKNCQKEAKDDLKELLYDGSETIELKTTLVGGARGHLELHILVFAPMHSRKKVGTWFQVVFWAKLGKLRQD